MMPSQMYIKKNEKQLQRNTEIVDCVLLKSILNLFQKNVSLGLGLINIKYFIVFFCITVYYFI